MPFDRHSAVYRKLDEFLLRYSREDDPEMHYAAFKEDLEMELCRVEALCAHLHPLTKTRRPLRVLEVGIGYAIVTTAMHHTFGPGALEIHALEHPDRKYLRMSTFQEQLRRTRVTLTPYDILAGRWPFPAGRFDIVLFSEVLEHLPPTRLPGVLDEIARVLSDGGRLVGSSPNLAAWRVRWKMLRGKSPFDPAVCLDWAPGTYGHIRLYTGDEMAALCRRSGMRPETIQYRDFGLVKKRRAVRRLTEVLYRYWGALAPNLVFAAVRS